MCSDAGDENGGCMDTPETLANLLENCDPDNDIFDVNILLNDKQYDMVYNIDESYQNLNVVSRQSLQEISTARTVTDHDERSEMEYT